MLNPEEFASEESSEEGINISPLIDIVFILLLFFVVTSVFIEETGVEVNKPDSSHSQDMDRESILIAVTAQGKIHYAGQEIGLYGIEPTLRRLSLATDHPVIIQADGQSQTQTLISVIDEVKNSGLENVNIATLNQ